MQKKRVFSGLIAAVILAGGGWAAATKVPWSEISFEDFDLSGTLAKIHERTEQLGDVNQGIIQGIQKLEEQSGKTKEVNQKLSRVGELAGAQVEQLNQIRVVTGQQVPLSQNLHSLSQRLANQMDTISKSGGRQATQAGQLKKITEQTEANLNEVLQQNVLLEEKLGQAAEVAEQVKNSLP